MLNVFEVLADAGGIAEIESLRSAGVSRRVVDQALANGAIMRVRRGWYALNELHPQRIRAVRVGGSLACISGAERHGLWTPDVTELHVSVDHGARHIKHPDTGASVSRERHVDGLVIHWDGTADRRRVGGLLELPLCLAQVVRCQPPEVAFAVVESALKNRRLTGEQWRWLELQVARERQAILRQAGRVADSGSESVFRYRIWRCGIDMRSQVVIPGVGRVDFVIGDRLVIEIDSNAYHGSSKQRLRDLRRDAILAGLDFICLRFDYQQVMYDWATVESAVLATVARGDHLSAGRQSRH